MTNEPGIQKPITEQIHDAFLALLEEHEEFDPETIKELRRLAQKGGLKSAQKVTRVIKVTPEQSE